MGWGIVYPPYSILNMGGNPTPQTRWVYNFNGVDQRLSSDIQLQNGDILTFATIIYSSPSIHLLMSASDVSPRFYLGVEAGNLLFGYGAQRVVGASFQLGVPLNFEVSISSNIMQVKVNGSIEFTSTQQSILPLSIATIGSGITGFYLDCSIYDLKINDGSVYNYPINDRTFGAGAVIANSGTGPNATGVNLLESGWEEIPL